MKTTYRHIAKQTGLSRGYVHGLLTGKNSNPTSYKLLALGSFFKCKPILEVIRAKYARLTGIRPAAKQTITDTGISGTPDKIEAAQ